NLYGIDCQSEDIFFSFETVYTPYQQLLIGDTPRVDLVIFNKQNSTITKGLEIKLTALPDNTTCDLSESEYGSEIVIRPDTIVYLACSIAMHYKNNLKQLNSYFSEKFNEVEDWSDAINVLPLIKLIKETINNICLDNIEKQEPLVMQPVWKTEGKTPRLSENCLDVFIWSNLAFIELFSKENTCDNPTRITRQTRTLIWLFKMLYDFSITGQIDHKTIIDELSYNTKNDKAFAVSGNITHQFMASEELTTPRIIRADIKNIILGGGQDMLSPERRFDAIIYNSPDLFK
ncbi:MAG: HindVP family restriction endonuclease, partial [Rikenellaceae bacterium]